MGLAMVEILDPEGSVKHFTIDQAEVNNISQKEDGTVVIRRSDRVGEKYPQHRVHKTVWRPDS
jgi:hypothetical protein